MKVIHIAPYSPVPPIFGGALRVYHLLRGLARRHEVTFVTFGKDEDFEQLKLTFGGIVKEIHVVQPNSLMREHPWLGMLRAFRRSESLYSQYTTGTNMQATLDHIYANDRYDVTLMEFPHMGKFRYDNHSLKILDEHNVEYTNFFRMYKSVQSPARKLLYYREHRKTYREELAACRKVDAIFATSENDVTILDEQIPGLPKFVVPNGVDVDYFVPSFSEPEPYSMVFTGTMDYTPNQDAMFFFLDNIFPLIKNVLPHAKLYVVGKNPPNALKRRSSRDIIVTGYVDDVRPYTWKASVYVVPLRMGSGTRLKILEGLAMKKAIVTTTIGCEGIDVRNGRDVLIADDPASFAAEVVELLLNRGKALTLGLNGHELVKSHYDWEVITASMDTAMSSLVNEKSRSQVSTVIPVTRGQQDSMSSDDHQYEQSVEPPIKVLMYHRVVADSSSNLSYSWNVTQSQFHRQLTLLNRWGYTCINFEDYTLFQQGKLALPKKPIIMTFDDGYEGVYKHALPTMREFGARATAFILGDRSIRTNFWDEPSGFEGAPLMDDEMILEIQKSGFEIASHTMTHPDLTRLSGSKAQDEIMRSKDNIEDLIERPVVSFAYPFGASNSEVETMVRDAGYLFGCGVYSGPPRFSQNLYNIRRIPVTRRTNTVDFALKMLTPYEYYEWIRWETVQRLHGNRVKVDIRKLDGDGQENEDEPESE